MANAQEIDQCPNCGSTNIVPEGGCAFCPECGRDFCSI